MKSPIESASVCQHANSVFLNPNLIILEFQHKKNKGFRIAGLIFSKTIIRDADHGRKGEAIDKDMRAVYNRFSGGFHRP